MYTKQKSVLFFSTLDCVLIVLSWNAQQHDFKFKIINLVSFSLHFCFYCKYRCRFCRTHCNALLLFFFSLLLLLFFAFFLSFPFALDLIKFIYCNYLRSNENSIIKFSCLLFCRRFIFLFLNIYIPTWKSVRMLDVMNTIQTDFSYHASKCDNNSNWHTKEKYCMYIRCGHKNGNES